MAYPNAGSLVGTSHSSNRIGSMDAPLSFLLKIPQTTFKDFSNIYHYDEEKQFSLSLQCA